MPPICNNNVGFYFFALSIRLFYTMATLMLAFGSPGENHKFLSLSERQTWETHFSVLLFASALSNMLFPALSFLAVGGIMFLITNMQVCAHTHTAHTSQPR